MTVGNVIVNDVGPRDGLQSQAKILSPDQRIALVAALLDAGLRHVEAGAFVSPRAVPAMAGTGEVLAGVHSHPGAGDSVLLFPTFGHDRVWSANARAHPPLGLPTL